MDAAVVSDVELVIRTHAGDRDAFGELVGRHQSAVCAVAYTVVGDVGRSEDVAQEAFVAAWKQVGELRDLTKFRAWVCGIARNLALATARRERKSRPLDDAIGLAAPGPTPAERAVSQEEQALVWQALGQLPGMYREPLVLFYREGESVTEVATALDLSPSAVKQRLSRGREMLRADLAATIESALKRSAPSTVFTAAVLAGLPGIGAATASAATMGGVAKGSLPAAKAAASVGSSAAGGALLGLAGAALGTWCSWQSARYRRERELYRRAIIIYALGFAIFVAPFAAMGLGWWGPLAIGQPAYLAWFVAWMLGFFAASGLWTWRLIRQWRRVVAEEAAAGSPELPMTPLRQWHSTWEGRQWTSSRMLLGLPLVDVNFASPYRLAAGQRSNAARGWIAFGDKAYGVILAVGNVAVGGIAVGGALSVGVISLGGIATGGLAIGGLSLGVIGVGGLGAGLFALGGMALGWIAYGGGAVAWKAAKGGGAWAHDFAIGGSATAAHANDRAAETFVEQCWFFSAADRLTAAMSHLPGWWPFALFAAIALAAGTMLPIAYRRRKAPDI
ncbi:MAG: RNA polymerase sigma factor [Pirellulales bacterium]